MSQTIDPIVFARFMVMDGATRLVEAFSGIPEGPLRESVIHMAETMRATYAGAPASQQAPDPLATLGSVFTPPPPPRPALPSPKAGPVKTPGPKTDDPTVTAVRLRLEGKFPHEIVTATGLSISHVYKAIGDARKAGVMFPDIGRASPNVTPRDDHYLTDMSQLTSAVQVGSVNRAAANRGITPEAYMGRRKLALDMALDGRHIRAIIAATGEDKATLSNWFHIARGVGHAVPYMVDETFVKPVENVIPLKPKKASKSGHRQVFILRMEDYEKAGGAIRVAINRGARMKGVDVPEYLRLRREAIALLSTGITQDRMAQTLGLSRTQASNWRERAQAAGLLTPKYQHKA